MVKANIRRMNSGYFFLLRGTILNTPKVGFFVFDLDLCSPMARAVFFGVAIRVQINLKIKKSNTIYTAHLSIIIFINLDHYSECQRNSDYRFSLSVNNRCFGNQQRYAIKVYI